MDSSAASTAATTSTTAQSDQPRTKGTGKKRAPRAAGTAKKTGAKSKVQKKNLTKPSLKRLLNVGLGVKDKNGTMRISKNAALEADRQFNRDLTKYSVQLFTSMKKNKITQAKRPFMRREMVNQPFGYLLGSDIQQRSPFFDSTK